MSTNNQNVLPPSVNLHFWRPCNMRCRFCFATYEDTADELPRGHLPREQLLDLIDLLADAGARKLTFVGGEPTLCPWLGELITHAKQRRLTTMVVTNGWKLRDPEYMSRELGDLDWLTLSVDSVRKHRNLLSGRAHRGAEVLSADDLLAIGARARELNMALKLNTVVHTHNADDDLRAFVRELQPQRWKLFRVLPVDGQNDAHIAELEISQAQFDDYVARHRELERLEIDLVPEDNNDMRGTYAMIDPRGCFYDSVDGRYCYSAPILEVGVERAWTDIRFSPERFVERGGAYSFERPKTPRDALARARELHGGPRGPLVFGADVEVGIADLAADAGPPDKILDHLGHLAELAQARREGPLGRTMVMWLRAHNVDVSSESASTRSCASAQQRRCWHDGHRVHEFSFHTKPNNNTRPDRLVRIYFDWDSEREVIVIGWIGRHP